MKLTREEIEQVAELAHIALGEDEIIELHNQFNDFIQFVETINDINTDDVEPTYYLLPLKNVWRPDQHHQPLAPDEVFHNTHEHDGGFFKVPRIL